MRAQMLRQQSAIGLAIVLLSTALPGSPVRLPVRAQSPNPCAAAITAESASPMRDQPERAPKYGQLGADTRDIREVLRSSAAASAARARSASLAASRPFADRDENNIAILEDNNGDLISRPNPFDLANRGLRFEPSAGGYTVASVGSEFRSSLGRALTLGDDDSTTSPTGFPFEFYGRRFTSLFLNSDGNLTFEESDNASSERGIQRLANGPPRIAPFFADLDPSAGGRVFVDSAPDAMTITWCAVPAFDSDDKVTVQTVLFASGAIEFRFATVELSNAIVALSPGRVEGFTPIDLSRAAEPVAASVATGEVFSASAELNLLAASRRFYASHPDQFDQLVFWTDTPVMTDAFAFETTVKNAITGTGLDVFDFSSELGSAGALHSIINMDRISKYPDSPSLRIFGENSTLGILAHETGHRWLTRILFTDVNRSVSDLLLGRQRAHWSFFLDSDGSVMEGNEIEDLGGGAFRTASTSEKYSRLDQYAMGLVSASDVPPWFYVDAPLSRRDREESPMAGVTINGTRRDVTIQQVIEAVGPRVPAVADSPRVHRQAYIFVRRPTAVLDTQDLARLRRIREEFGAFFSRATENRMTVRTTLTP